MAPIPNNRRRRFLEDAVHFTEVLVPFAASPEFAVAQLAAEMALVFRALPACWACLFYPLFSVRARLFVWSVCLRAKGRCFVLFLRFYGYYIGCYLTVSLSLFRSCICYAFRFLMWFVWHTTYKHIWLKNPFSFSLSRLLSSSLNPAIIFSRNPDELF